MFLISSQNLISNNLKNIKTVSLHNYEANVHNFNNYKNTDNHLPDRSAQQQSQHLVPLAFWKIHENSNTDNTTMFENVHFFLSFH